MAEGITEKGPLSQQQKGADQPGSQTQQGGADNHHACIVTLEDHYSPYFTPRRQLKGMLAEAGCPCVHRLQAEYRNESYAF